MARLKAGEVSVPPLVFQWAFATRPNGNGPDATAVVVWQGRACHFVAEIKARSTPKILAQAVEQARGFAQRTGENPMVVIPYLAPERLDELEKAGVSGIDLCGNAIVQVPGQFLVLRSGGQNKFRESYPIRAVYQGATSLVGRALLLRAEAESLSDLEGFIRSRGGSVTLTTISKALRRMEDDVLIRRRGGWARVLQPESLLDKLAAAYRLPKVRRTFVGSVDLGSETLGRMFASLKSRAVLTGRSSTGRYAVMGREERVQIYCESISEVLGAIGKEVKPGERFSNLELLETVDATVYFDAREADASVFASPIQAYLELASGDKREQDAARQVRAFILAEHRQAIEGQ